MLSALDFCTYCSFCLASMVSWTLSTYCISVPHYSTWHIGSSNYFWKESRQSKNRGSWTQQAANLKTYCLGASLVAQWLRIRLPMQGSRVRALVQEDPTYHGATKPMGHNYWVCALEPTSHNYCARVPQLLKPAYLEPMLLNKRSHHNEKPAHRNEE